MVDSKPWPPKPGASDQPSFVLSKKWHSLSSSWFRVHTYNPATWQYGATQFNDSALGNARFSPLVDPGTKQVVPTIYAAGSKATAIAEVLLHDAPTPSQGYIHDWQRDCKGHAHLSEIGIPPLNLVDLTSLGLKGAGFSVSDFFEGNKPDYPRTRSWALHIWQTMPTAQGLWWMSVRDNTTPVLVLFGDRCAPNILTVINGPSHIRNFEADVVSVLATMQAIMNP